uniref:glucuronate isomerase n=1 Tax=Tessaracoccus timonensis TaxID=2161816 RepID=UPI000D561DCB|nr:glucuronate isomerase [Tessaracoccus timonensis]
MSEPLTLHPDRLFPADPKTREIARELYARVADLPIISPHGHVPVQWLADDTPFTDPTTLLLTPDHYTNRLLHSVAGVELEDLGVPVGSPMSPEKSREAFRIFCSNWKVFRGTQVQFWFESQFVDVFGIDVRPSAETADRIYDQILERLGTDEYKPRALYKRFNIDFLATTDDPCDDLAGHQQLVDDPTWDSRVVPTFRPDKYLEPARAGWVELTKQLGGVAGVEIGSYADHLEAMRIRRRYFVDHGAVSSDHSHRDARCARLDDAEAERLFARALAGEITVDEGDALRAHMVNDQARLAVEDGLVMTLHPAVYRNHDTATFERYGADVGGDVPLPVEFASALQPILSEYGNADGFQLVVFTMDETVYSRELAPLAGWYRGMYIGAPWWFIDENDAMMRFRRATTGYGTLHKGSGFIDDTRAFCSIPARHDAARRVDSAYLAGLVAEHRLSLDEAAETAVELVTTQPKRAFKL